MGKGSDAAAAFLAAPFEEAGWDRALKTLARETRSARAQILAVGGPTSIPFNWVTDSPDGFIEGFVEIGGGNPAINWRIAAAGAPLEVASEADYDRVRADMKADIYNDFVSLFDLPFGCQAVLIREPRTFIGMAALRTSADGRTEEADRQVFAEAAPNALAAIRMQRAIEHQGAVLVAGALEAMRAIAFVCDGRGRVGALTAAAERWLGGQPGLRLAEQRLAAIRPQDDRALQRGLAAAIHGPGEAAPARFWLGDSESPTLCEIFALPRREWSLGFAPRALVVLRPPAGIDAEGSLLLGDLLDFTQAESDIVARLARGHSREEIARARGVSAATVATQIKTIFRKADVRREAELIARVNRILR